MPWMLDNEQSSLVLKDLLQKDTILKVPGVHNPLTAQIAKNLNFSCLYISGAAFSASRCLPDLSYFTINELTEHIRQIYRVTKLPLIVDIDTGFGEVLQLARTIVDLEEAGAAAVQIEDQKIPKKCGHVEGKELISAEDMCRKIEAIKRVRNKLLIVARTDAHAILGQDEAVRRSKMYEKAGADIIFPEALKTEAEFKHFTNEISIPLLANMTEFGKTPYISAETFYQWGYKIVIYPVTTLRVAMKAVENVLKTIQETGTQESMLDSMQTRKELYTQLDYDGYIQFDNEISKLEF